LWLRVPDQLKNTFIDVLGGRLLSVRARLMASLGRRQRSRHTFHGDGGDTKVVRLPITPTACAGFGI
jgi:hypothetical protein